ncbi:ubiquinol-cytochrome c reductase iron-sulfur subunit [Spirosoma spitsbergense]|uniref:QcrA and Rieske domain-containing protein n=1 Tax=Spirosoma spitsbergense TaxID=431554 RepID=UPI000475AE35|nr:Rieske 2Fe-2S domain-containing protein [Spirosoma spitsbergense]
METTLPPTEHHGSPRHTFFRSTGIGLVTLLLMHLAFGCSGQSGSDTTLVPVQGINFTLNLTDKANENLTVKGGYVITNNVIIAQTKSGNFVAVSVNCTYDKTRLVFKATENQFYCPADLSRFDTTGKVISGPATLPLTAYKIEPNAAAGTLVVHN